MYTSNKPIIQIAYAVKNVKKAASFWSKRFNIGPFYVNEHIQISNTLVNKKTSKFDHSSAYGWSENMMIELICDHKIKETPRNSNQKGMHHIAWIAPDFDKERQILEENDCVEVLSANAGHRDGMRFAWFDPGNDINHFYEIYEKSQEIENFYSLLHEKSKKWDGLDPIRDISDIS